MSQENKELLEVVGFALSLVEGIASLVDGGVSFSDVVKFVEAARRAPAAFKDIHLALPELKNLSDAGKEELKKFIEEDFDIPQDNIELAIESALKVAVDLSDLLKVLG